MPIYKKIAPLPTEGAYTLTALRRHDMEAIRKWRNAQIDILRQKKRLTAKDQARYWRGVIAPASMQSEPDLILFSFLHNKTCIGYGGFVHIDWESRRAEISFLLDPKRSRAKYQKEFGIFLNLMKHIGFIQLGLNRLWTETFDVRPYHVSILESHEFVPEGRMREHVRIRGVFADSLVHGCLRSAYRS